MYVTNILLSPILLNRQPSSPGIGVIDNVVMHQRCGMDHLRYHRNLSLVVQYRLHVIPSHRSSGSSSTIYL